MERMPLLMGTRCRTGVDGGDGSDENADDSDEGTTIVGGSAPQSPCLWQTAKRSRGHDTRRGHDTSDERDDGDNKENAETQVSTTRVPLDTLFGASKSSSIATMKRTSESQTQSESPVIDWRNSPVAEMKDTFLLASLETEMKRCQQQSQSLSPSSSLWSSPIAPQASEPPPSPPSPPQAPMPVQVPRAPTSHTFVKPKPPARPRALMLSPMSQLNVLSQISEMADRQAQEAVTPAPSTSPNLTSEDAGSCNRMKKAVQRSRQHAWAPALKTGKKRPSESTATSSAQDPKKTKKVPARRANKAIAQYQAKLSEATTSDMLDWETCSEDIFLADPDYESEDDHWVFEDISDSDFE